MMIDTYRLKLMLILAVITIIWIAYEIYLLPKGRYTIETDFASWKTDHYEINNNDCLVFKTHLGEEIEICGRYTIKDEQSN